ncbi:MAG: P1 family peptidase [Acidimicrobiales bacterium]
MLSDVPGVRVGHWTNGEARTGCTVVLLPRKAVASGEIRGGAPATREFALLEPWRMIPSIDAVVLSGGSAFGLAAADGVIRWLEEHGRGFVTNTATVPIVVGMSLYDLGVGDASVRPGPAEGRAAAEAAGPDPDPASSPETADPLPGASDSAANLGLIGAGTGATVGKWGGPDTTRPGGLVTATIRSGDVIVSALLAANAYGWVDDGTTVADPGPPIRPAPADDGEPGSTDALTTTNTTIGVVVTNAVVDKVGCHLLAQSAHDGLARALVPAHTAADGDALVAVATGQVEADLMHLRLLAQHAVTRAIRTLL